MNRHQEVLNRLAALAGARVYGVSIGVNEKFVFVDSNGDPICDDGREIGASPYDGDDEKWFFNFSEKVLYAACVAKAQEIEANLASVP